MTTSNTNEEVGTNIFFAMGECSLGSILVAQSARGVCSILIGEDRAQLAQDLRNRSNPPHRRRNQQAPGR